MKDVTAGPDNLRPVKDEESEHPIAAAWRPTFCEIVASFRRGDYGLAGVPSVDTLEPETQEQIRKYISDYGETLTELPPETWGNSVAQWMGTHWETLVDLWTEGEGRSDLALQADVFESGNGYCFKVHLVYVP